MGGFGWAARELARLFADSRKIEAIFLSAGEKGRWRRPRHLHGARIYYPSQVSPKLAASLNLVICIDYRPKYDRVLDLTADRPVLIWSRDPRDRNKRQIEASLRLPGKPEVHPAGFGNIDCTGLGRRVAREPNRKYAVAATTAALTKAASDCYALPDIRLVLPNVVTVSRTADGRSERPSFVFLGRVDPIKRPWIFWELAARMQGCDFIVLGRNHFGFDPAGWTPGETSANLQWLGHIDGAAKVRILSRAWALVNTSIHEGLATSFLEALACELPIVACVDVADVVSRFGTFVGSWDGDGLDAVPSFQAALDRIAHDPDWSERVGREGASWVRKEFGPRPFLAALSHICAELGVAFPEEPIGGEERVSRLLPSFPRLRIRTP